MLVWGKSEVNFNLMLEPTKLLPTRPHFVEEVVAQDRTFLELSTEKKQSAEYH